MTCRKWQRECLSIAQDLGVEDAAIDGGSKHAKIVGTVAGRPFAFPIGRSPGTSWRMPKKVRSGVARTIRELQAGGGARP